MEDRPLGDNGGGAPFSLIGFVGEVYGLGAARPVRLTYPGGSVV